MQSPFKKIIENPELNTAREAVFAIVKHFDYSCQGMASIGHALTVTALELMEARPCMGFNFAARNDTHKEVTHAYARQFLASRIELACGGRKADPHMIKVVHQYEDLEFPAAPLKTQLGKPCPLSASDLRVELRWLIFRLPEAGMDMFTVFKALLDAACVCYMLTEEGDTRYRARLAALHSHIVRLVNLRADYFDALDNFSSLSAEDVV